jgi:phosphatidylglycerophosphatase A
LWYFYIVVTVFFLGIWSIPEAERQLGPMTDPHGKIRDRDQNQIGVDETLGMLITTIPIFLSVRDHTPHWLILAFWYISAFFIFRFFDMVKLWPASYFDKKIKNEWGVMLDDAFAGVYAAVCLLIWMHYSHGFIISFS